MTEHAVRGPLTASIVISVLGAAITWGATWGVYSERLNRQEKSIQDLQTLVLAHDRQITTVNTQYAEIIRRLERIERKTDREREP